MKKHQKHTLTPQQAKTLYRQFPVTSVCRADLVGVVEITEQDALIVQDDEMERIAHKLADAYCENVFWIDLPIIVEQVLEEREA